MGERIGYIRVSTSEQNTARQEELLENAGVNKLFMEKTSGKDRDRPELKRLMEYVREGDTVIVESYSRFARSTKDLLSLMDELKQKGVGFISLKEQIDTATPQGQLMLTIFAGLAQFERESILQRQREGIEIAKRNGRMGGRPMKELPDFEKAYDDVIRDRKRTVTDVCREYHISRSTWYARVKRYEDGRINENLGTSGNGRRERQDKP